ncbi:MAG: NAD+ synthase [bacterium]|nr:NAD+ synthase [bacterium]
MELLDEISRWIKKEVESAGCAGAVVGISGGIDSAVVAYLAKKALGDSVLGLIMPCYSGEEDIYYANLVIKSLGIRCEKIDLIPAYDKLIGTLPKGDRLAYANLKPRLRMLTLYYFANSLNYLVAGTGNKSEIMVGYFTKYGDGGVDILPIGGLLKREVKKLAKELDIPKEIIKRPPGAGLWPGQTDEGEMGITYDELDSAISALEEKRVEGIRPEILSRVENLIKSSCHKRKLPKTFVVTENRSSL